MLYSIHDSAYKTLQLHLRAIRPNAGLTQSQIATELGIGQSYVSKIERGEAYIDIFLYIKWCQTCQANPSLALDALIRSLNI